MSRPTIQVGSSARPGTRSEVVLARILIVDDNLLARTLLRDILTGAGHDVVGEARDGLQAPACVRELHPDVVTLDLVMPGRSGLTTLPHMLMVDPSLAVVVCSASLDQSRVIDALRLGAKGFIVKPFDRQTVLDGVRDVLGQPQLASRRSEPVEHVTPICASHERASLLTGESDGRGEIARLHRVCCGLAGELREILERSIDTG